MPPSPPNPQGQDLAAILWSLAGPLFTAVMGVLMRHAEQVASGRPFSPLRLLLEGPTAICMAILGGAIGEWLQLSALGCSAIAGALAYLGPPAILLLVARVTARPPAAGGRG